MELYAANRWRAAGGGHVVRHCFEAHGCEEVWPDFCGRAEESGAVRRDGRDHPARPGRTRRADKIAKILQYRTQIKERSLYHTPSTFAIYTVGLVLEWIEAEGGVAAMEKRNAAKAKLLYDTIDAGGYYQCPVEKIAVEDERGVPRGGRRRGRRGENLRRKPKLRASPE